MHEIYADPERDSFVPDIVQWIEDRHAEVEGEL